MSPRKDFFRFFSVILLLLASIFFLESQTQVLSTALKPFQKKEFTVVIDSGHGGMDAGKIGVDGTLEKDVNLSIAGKLKKLLEAADVHVIMTRESDTGLYDENASSKKTQDLTRRAALMNEASPDCIISIHQNSYPEESVQGAQVFYRTGSDTGKALADAIQKELIAHADPQNKRQIKENSSYFLFRKTTAPIAIVECGFLSNWTESKKLVDDEYQQKLAWAIHIGVLQFLNAASVSDITAD